jgi:polyhydroxyalkanoate synthase
MLGFDIWDNGNQLLERTRTDKHLGKLGLAATPSRVIHKENKLQVRFYEKKPAPGVDLGKTRVPILIVPSLINRHYILDLLPDKSLVRFLRDRGFDVAMIDWGMPGDEDRHVAFERFLDSYINRAIQALARETGCKKPVLLGYCLGGTMAAIHAAHRPENIAGLITLTAPINFHNSGLLSAWCRSSHDPRLLIEAFGNAPWHVLQTSFQWLRPTMNAVRSLTMWRRSRDADFIESSMALDIWVNDNVSFPGECYQQMITSLYRDNALINGTLKLYNETVDFERLTCPVLNVAAQDDHIVPLDATQALRTLARSTDYAELLSPGGHIGAVISKKASAVLWPQIANWLESRFSTESKANRPARAVH